MIAENIKLIRERIAAAASRASRHPASIELIVSTKGRSLPEIEEAIRSGITVIGENKVQEAKEKHRALGGRVSMHMIGHLQRNKVREALRIFDMIHSVDSFRLAEEIECEAEKQGLVVPVLLEVNVSGEESKYGLGPDALASLIEKLSPMEHLKAQGLMTMPPVAADPEEARPFFRKLKALAAHIEERAMPGVGMRHLSMGMTNDFEVAIEEGATMVRIGTAIFGE